MAVTSFGMEVDDTALVQSSVRRPAPAPGTTAAAASSSNSTYWWQYNPKYIYSFLRVCLSIPVMCIMIGCMSYYIILLLNRSIGFIVFLSGNMICCVLVHFCPPCCRVIYYQLLIYDQQILFMFSLKKQNKKSTSEC